MTGSRSAAAAAFFDYVERVRAGEDPDLEQTLARHPAELADELRSMISDWSALRGRLGDRSALLSGGRELGDFRLERELGHGGMAVVWEAEQVSLRRSVALKLLTPQHALSKSAVARFEREARAGGRLTHPGIVQTYGTGEADGIHYIVQELIPSGFTLADSLNALRESSKVPEGYYRGVAVLFAKIADALAYAHTKGIIHRDVKPSNILVTEDDEPRVADFGLARIQNELGLSRTGDIEGTPFYMSPEQAAAKSMGLDHRTDVFSLGSTLYEALTLRRPFDGDTSQHVLKQILTNDPPDPREVRSKVPQDLCVICLRALEKDPDLRFQTMEEFATDLRRFLANEPIVSRPPGPIDRGIKWTRRHPIASTTGAVTLLGLIVVTSLWMNLLRISAERESALGALEAQKARLEIERRNALELAELARARERELVRARKLPEALNAIEAAVPQEAFVPNEIEPIYAIYSDAARQLPRHEAEVLRRRLIQRLDNLIEVTWRGFGPEWTSEESRQIDLIRQLLAKVAPELSKAPEAAKSEDGVEGMFVNPLRGRTGQFLQATASGSLDEFHAQRSGTVIEDEYEYFRRLQRSVQLLDEDWFVIDTPGFILFASSGSKDDCLEIARALHVQLGILKRYLPGTHTSAPPGVIRIFSSNGENLPHGGIGFDRLTEEICLLGPPDLEDESFWTSLSESVLRQYLRGAYGPVEFDPWFEEGLASFACRISVVADETRVGVDPVHIEALRIIDPDHLHIQDLFALTSTGFAVNEQLNSALLWGMTYFLLEVADEASWNTIPAEYARLSADLYDAFLESDSYAPFPGLGKVRDQVLGRVDMDALNSAFRTWIASLE